LRSVALDAASLFEKAAAYAAAFRKSVGNRPQRPEQTYPEAVQAFEEPTPESGTPGELVLDDLVTRATPGLHTHIGPRFYGWVAEASHPVGVAADWLASTWGRWSKRNPRTSGGARGLHSQMRQACQSTVGVAYPLQTRSQLKDRKSN
jgi:glutamate/tyrosine decarboxylase-like PLP-dependent enzyme